MADRPRPISDVHIRRFVLDRKVDVTGVSGTGVVAVGALFVDVDIAVVHWLSEFPTSVVWHSRGMDSIEAVHGHGGHTRIVFLDDEIGSALDLYGMIEANLGPVTGDRVLVTKDCEFFDDGDGEALINALMEQAAGRGLSGEAAEHIPLVIHMEGGDSSVELLDEAMMREHGWVRAGDREQRRQTVAGVLALRLGHAFQAVSDPPVYGPNTLAMADEILDALDEPRSDS